MDIASEIKKGNKRAAARLISMIENEDKEAAKILKACRKDSSKCRVIGITGSPGSGKSTLTDQLTKLLLKEKKKVGIIAVDPTSPITGGAFLGDRIRMSDLNGEPDVFIRSMGTRGALGGISRAVRGAVRVLEIFGMDYIFIETVGVGQSETDVTAAADVVVLVTVPGMGDDIQTEKAGILEIANVIAVNKADREGVARTIHDLKSLLYKNEETGRGEPVPIVSTIALTGEGVPTLASAIDERYNRMDMSGNTAIIRSARLKTQLRELIDLKFREQFEEFDRLYNEMDSSVEAILRTEADSGSEADRILKNFKKWNDRYV